MGRLEQRRGFSGRRFVGVLDAAGFAASMAATAFLQLVATALSALCESGAAGVMAMGSFLAGLMRPLTMQRAQR